MTKGYKARIQQLSLNNAEMTLEVIDLNAIKKHV